MAVRHIGEASSVIVPETPKPSRRFARRRRSTAPQPLATLASGVLLSEPRSQRPGDRGAGEDERKGLKILMNRVSAAVCHCSLERGIGGVLTDS